MKNLLRYGLLLGVSTMIGMSTAFAQLGEPKQPPLPGEQSDSSRGRFADRFLAQFDLNHDGKVTHDEFNKAVSQQFFAASHGAQTMTQDQFIAARTKDLRQQTNELFHRSDWNGDGRLSFDEYAAPERARFELLDHDGTGTVACSARRSYSDDEQNAPRGGKPAFGGAGRARSAGGSRGRSGFCSEFDLNRDGQVTRAELDQGLHQQFQSFSKGGSMNADQLYGLELARYREIDARIFQHMNTSYTGRLTLQEYAASEAKFFARLDKNGDGTITGDELSSRRRPSTTTRVAKSGR